MSRVSRLEVALRLREDGILPVASPQPEARALAELDACIRGGARCYELTHRGPKTEALVRALVARVRELDAPVAIGVGSVLDGATAGRFIDLGASFIVAPILDRSTAEACQRRGVLWIPGCGSATEVSQGQAWGADLVKLFPAAALGPSMLAGLRGPMPWSRIIPTGGLRPDEDSLRPWFHAGATAVGLGGSLFRDAEPKEISERVAHLLAIIKLMRLEPDPRDRG